MAVQFGPAYTSLTLFWTAWKQAQSSYSLLTQYDDDGTVYTIWGYNGQNVYSCTIWKGTVPYSITPFYSQATNDADKADFEAKFKPGANQSIATAVLPPATGTALTPDSSSNNTQCMLVGTVLPQIQPGPFTGIYQSLYFNGFDYPIVQGVQCGTTGVSASFTVEGKVKLNNASEGIYIVNKWGNTLSAENFRLFTFLGTAAIQVIDNGGVVRQIVAGTVTPDVNHDVAASYDGTNLRLFLDGVVVGTLAVAGLQAPDTVTSIYVGSNGLNENQPFIGSLGEVRVSTVARYTANYTPSTVQFENDANTLLLLHFNSVTGPQPVSGLVRNAFGSLPSFTACTNGIVLSGTAAASVQSLAYLFHTTSSTKVIKIQKIHISGAGVTGAAGLVTFRGCFITAENATPGGFTVGILGTDLDYAPDPTDKFIVGATGAPTRALFDSTCIATGTTTGGGAFEIDIPLESTPIVLRPARNEGFEIRMIVEHVITAALQASCFFYWTEE